MYFRLFLANVLALSFPSVQACGGGHDHLGLDEHRGTPSLGTLALRGTCRPKVAIYNVRVFDGEKVLPPSTVVIDGHLIGADPAGATQHMDAENAVLLPGFIDSHTHPGSVTDLESLTKYGVTTAYQLACFTPQQCPSLQGYDGLVDMFYASAPAAAPGSQHGQMVLNQTGNADLLVRGVNDTARWIEEQVSWEPDFFKIIIQTPGLSQDTLNSLVSKAHTAGRKAISHAADFASHRQAILSSTDQIHHTPLDVAIDESLAQDALARGQIVVPTLSVMKAFSELELRPGRIGNYTAARESVRIYNDMGVPILAGTDANNEIAAVIPFGESMHSELQLLVEAGMSNLDALRAATFLPALYWGLEDRGVVEPGKRADLILVDGDPLLDIKVTRNIKKVWVGGREFST